MHYIRQVIADSTFGFLTDINVTTDYFHLTCTQTTMRMDAWILTVFIIVGGGVSHGKLVLGQGRHKEQFMRRSSSIAGTDEGKKQRGCLVYPLEQKGALRCNHGST